MTTALKQSDMHRHPWLDQLEGDPKGSVSELLAGYADVFPYTRADAPDAARMLIGHLDSDDPACAAMGAGILAWLKEIRATPFPMDKAELQDFVRQVSEAFEIVSMVNLSTAALALRQSCVWWFDWVSKMNLSTSRDAQASFFRMLATTQPGISDRLSEPDALAPFWLRLCREAGTNLPKRYLQIGLLGLRRLPGPIERGESPWIAGLAAWALKQNPTDKEFMRAWNPIKRLHPATPRTLRKNVYNVLSQKPFVDADITSPGWWANDAIFPNAQASKGRAASMEPPSPDFRESILSDLREGSRFADVAQRLETLIERYERFTDATGDDYFLVRTFCNIGFALLRSSTDALTERAEVAERLAKLTLRYQPSNTIAWGLWRDAFFAGGKIQSAIALGWETTRRFPNDAHKRNELAEILLSEGEVSAALSVIEGALQAHVCDVVTYSIASRIYVNLGQNDAAKSALQAGLILEPTHEFLLQSLGKLNAGEPLSLPLVANARQRVAEARPDVIDIGLMGTSLSNLSRIRAIRSRLGSDAEALSELKEILEREPNLAYAQILAARQKIWFSSSVALPPIAAAFEEALANENRERLAELTEQMSHLTAIILLARAIIGDEVAAREISDRLRQPNVDVDYEAVEILRPRFKPVLKMIDSGTEPVKAIDHHAHQLLAAIYDANEALISSNLLVA